MYVMHNFQVFQCLCTLLKDSYNKNFERKEVRILKEINNSVS